MARSLHSLTAGPMRALGYWRALLSAAPTTAVAKTALRRVIDPPRYRVPRAASPSDAQAAAAALAVRPRLFPTGERATRGVRAVYRVALPGATERVARRAEAILRHEIELFGALEPLGPTIDWHRDVRSGHRFEPRLPSPELDIIRPASGLDPRGAWELARGHHLLELGVAARLVPSLRAQAAREVADQILAFVDDNPPGLGVHWTSPLEVALRVVHWLAALELVEDVGQTPALDGAARLRLGGALVEHGRFLAGNLEDRGVVAANHLLCDWLGLLALGVGLGPAAEAARWREQAVRAIAREAKRQVHGDGAAFEGSTSYHRFSLEILLAAHRFARAGRLPLDLGPTLAAMLRFVAGYLGPDGQEPAFGDGDDGRVLPLAPRAPRDHAYLLPLGAVLADDPRLRPAGVPFSEEAAWLDGAAGYRRWRAMPETRPPGTSSFPEGGVHVLRGAREQVALRVGGYGQRGVGGHAHNDQLSIALWLDGAPLVIDPGTHCYTADPMWRDHFRSTGAHATVVVDGAEQVPLFDGRLFALPDGAKGRRRAIVDEGERARVTARHRGYRRLPSGAVHEREVRLDRAARTILVVDRVRGRGVATVDVRFPLAATAHAAVRPARPGELRALATRIARLPDVEASGASDGALLPHPEGAGAVVVERDGRPWAALVPLGQTPSATVEAAWWSPRWGVRQPLALVRFSRRQILPAVCAVAFALVEEASERAADDLPAVEVA